MQRPRVSGRAAAMVAVALVFLVGVPVASAASTLYVNSTTGVDSGACGGAATPCRTIQQGVNNASPGDTIQVAAGTYAESVVVDRSVTLDGAQAGHAGTATRAASTAGETVLAAGNIDVESSDVTIDGFTFANPGNQVCAGCNAFNSFSGVTVENDVFVGYQTDFFGPWQVSGPVGVNHVADTVVTRNYFSSPGIDLGDYGGAVVQWFDGGCTGAVVSDNTFDSADASALSDIYFWCDSNEGETTGTITVSGNNDRATGSTDFALFTHIGGSAEVDVRNNTVSMTSNGSTVIYFSTDPGLAHVDISGNTVHGSPYRAVKLNPGAAIPGTVSITGNDFSGNGVGVYVGSGSLASGASVAVQGNNLADETGDTLGEGPDGVYNRSGVTVDATDNWWGCNTGPNTPGCSNTEGPVNSTPWLVLGITASPSSVTVGNSSTITADVTHDSTGAVAASTIPDGTTIAFATDFGVLSSPTATTIGGKASVLLTSPVEGTATVSATLDNQTVSTTVTFTKPPLPTSTDQCKNGGWQSYRVFRNQGDCVSFVATGGKKAPKG